MRINYEKFERYAGVTVYFARNVRNAEGLAGVHGCKNACGGLDVREWAYAYVWVCTCRGGKCVSKHPCGVLVIALHKS